MRWVRNAAAATVIIPGLAGFLPRELGRKSTGLFPLQIDLLAKIHRAKQLLLEGGFEQQVMWVSPRAHDKLASIANRGPSGYSKMGTLDTFAGIPVRRTELLDEQIVLTPDFYQPSQVMMPRTGIEDRITFGFPHRSDHTSV